ncbi:Na+/H+ antiporter NhaA [Propionibacterium sp.]|uniref:Na+/H+ antiporter NhaA n=1 Tax=Propionibacterium sp. TaxID=1977903 RepID=UPI0039EA9EE0
MPHLPRSFRSVRQRTRRWVVLETSSGLLLVIATCVALVWANSPWCDLYFSLSQWSFGPTAVHLHLPLSVWATDGLLAVFFFVVGVELKYEVVAGSLRRLREAAVPVLAAVGGMIVPAGIFSLIVLGTGDVGALHGWAIPTATDIAFALSVMGLFGRGLPRSLRTFLMTLAVVDDLLGIIVIAVFYTSGTNLFMLAAAVAAVAVFGMSVRTRRPSWILLTCLALLAWGFMHASGVHPTIAGVLLGFTVPARGVHGEAEPRTHRFGEVVGPFSSGVALPVFAFFAAGVTIVGGGDAAVWSQPLVWAVIAALVIGKPLGVLGMTALVTRCTPLRLQAPTSLRDLVSVGLVTGMGFTVSMLIAQLSFPDGEEIRAAKIGILLGSLIAALLAAAVMRRDAHHRWAAAESSGTT